MAKQNYKSVGRSTSRFVIVCLLALGLRLSVHQKKLVIQT